jgi:ABC-2 type transport system permease protein
MTAFTAHFTVEFRTGIRNKSLLLLNYLFPLGFYAVVSMIMTQINPMFTAQLLPAMVVFAVIVSTILGLPDPLVSARENGIFRSFKVNGVPALSILAIPALSTLLHLSIVSLIIFVTAPIFFDAPLPVNYPAFVVVFLAAAFAHAGLGVLIGVTSPSSRVTILLSQAIFLPSMLIGGLMMPFDILPAGIAKIAQIFPATQAMNAFMGLAMGSETSIDPTRSLIMLFVGGLLAFGLALFLFTWDSKNASRKRSPLLGLLAFVPYLFGLL